MEAKLFWDKIDFLLAMYGVSMSKVTTQTRLLLSTISTAYHKRTYPNADAILRMSCFFKVSPELLMSDAYADIPRSPIITKDFINAIDSVRDADKSPVATLRKESIILLSRVLDHPVSPVLRALGGIGSFLRDVPIAIGTVAMGEEQERSSSIATRIINLFERSDNDGQDPEELIKRLIPITDYNYNGKIQILYTDSQEKVQKFNIRNTFWNSMDHIARFQTLGPAALADAVGIHRSSFLLAQNKRSMFPMATIISFAELVQQAAVPFLGRSHEIIPYYSSKPFEDMEDEYAKAVAFNDAIIINSMDRERSRAQGLLSRIERIESLDMIHRYLRSRVSENDQRQRELRGMNKLPDSRKKNDIIDMYRAWSMTDTKRPVRLL